VGSRPVHATRETAARRPPKLTPSATYFHHPDVSKPVQYDSLLVHALCAALRSRYGGARVRAIQFDGQARVFRLLLARRALVWDIDANGGGLWEEPSRGTPTGIVLPAGARLTTVRAAPDDRLVEFVIATAGENGAQRDYSLWVELLPNRRNAILTEGTKVLGSLQRLNPQTAGTVTWTPPERRPRRGAAGVLTEDDFVSILLDAGPDGERRALLSEVAWTSQLNAGAILGEAGTPADAYNRYLRILAAARDGGNAVVLGPGEIDQPYPSALAGARSRPAASLIQAFEEVAPVHRQTAGEPDPAEILARLRRRLRSESARLDRLEAEFAGAGRDATLLRRNADLLLGQLHTVRRGQTEAVLEDWEGGQVTLPLDPSLDPAANAAALYEQAKKRDRAGRRLPGLIESARDRVRRLTEDLRKVESGQIDEVTAAALLPPGQAASRKAARPERALPYRLYRTGGGLEVRVGRGSRANDELTLRHSSPDDIWLHARDVAGAHVVLRWSRRDENPPAGEIAQAAILAALHSRARTSGVVPVDWTRRKYVRKPRKAPPGRVVVDRAKTIFVVPDPDLEERMRVR